MLGAASASSDNFAYEPAGGLTGALVAGHTLSYAYAGRRRCGASASAGLNTSRTARSEDGATTRYGYAGAGDAPAFTTDGSGGALEPMIALVGGVLLSRRLGGDTWSYPNVHGDVAAEANASGAKVGATRHWDPDGAAP